MDHRKSAEIATTVDFWRGMAWASVGTAAAGVTAVLAAVVHQSVMVGSVIAAGIWLYRDRARRRERAALS